MKHLRMKTSIRLLAIVLALILGLSMLLLISPAVAHAVGDKPNKEDWTPDEWILAQIIYREAGNQDCIGQLAVAQVVINRIEAGYHPDTVREVCLQRHQFTPTDNKKRFLRTIPTEKELLHARAALNDYYREKQGLPRIMPKVIPDNILYFCGRSGRNHFYYLSRGMSGVRIYVKVGRGTCDYCKALKAVQELGIVD